MAAQLAIPDQADPLLAGPSIPSDAPTRGRWSPARPGPLAGRHRVLLPTGVVLSCGTPLGQGIQDGRALEIWDPARGLDPRSHLTLPNAEALDSLGTASTWPTTGAMLISAGDTPASARSALTSTAFAPARERAANVGSNLASPRWYGSMISLADGRALMVGGGVPDVVNAWQNPSVGPAANRIAITPEMFDPAIGWRTLRGATSRDAFGPDPKRWCYPRLRGAPDGSVFEMSSDKAWRMSAAGSGSTTTSATFTSGHSTSARPKLGPTSIAALDDVRLILQVGGNGPTLAFREQPAMATPRRSSCSTARSCRPAAACPAARPTSTPRSTSRAPRPVPTTAEPSSRRGHESPRSARSAAAGARR